MSLNAIQEGEVITLAAPYDVVSGAGAQVGAIFGVAQITALSGVDVPLQRCGVWELAKVSAQAWSVGDTVWWDNSAKKATNVKTMSNLRIGKCVEAAANPTSTGKLVLTPDSDAPRIVWGQATTVAASDTIATGLSLLVGVVAQFDSDIVADPEFLK
ncbi:MAG: DUF2190 family protein, partial [Alphaproteobacteria bacterium]|nr:DUF2190 family protein [Alphaproteobacteria bacterium]